MKKINNPLTIIALFAGIVEISGSIVLPLLHAENQLIYVWFLIVFPILLIILFFLTLNFNHKVLYAPSDFKDEQNFLKFFSKPSAEEIIKKLDSEISNQEVLQNPINKNDKELDTNLQNLKRRNMISLHYMSEELVIKKLSKEYDKLDKEVMLRSNKAQFLFDAIAKKDNKIFAIEVKYVKDCQSLKRIRSVLMKMQRTLNELLSEIDVQITVILAVATDVEGDKLLEIENKINHLLSSFKFPHKVQVFNLHALEIEFFGT